MSFELEEEEEELFEHTLLVVREVSVFKIPPRSTSGGYKCGEWLQSDKIWSGRLRVVSCLGFTERNEAFDFNVALSDHEKYVKRETEKDDGEATDESHINIHPAVNNRLKEGETIRITVKNKPATGAGMLSTAGLSGGVEKIKPLSLAASPATSTKLGPSGTDNVKPLGIAPPPASAGKIRSLIPPPPNDPAAARMTVTNHKETGRKSTDTFADLSQLEASFVAPVYTHYLDA
ncbi:hypothetical protein E3N88_11340 [Mikania micrantha]|uniref:NECAP PHear domain-containing protein n=1 Tax=Mikania micrantha TaxID=192012 RepID=A0A5N6PE89_9ASTR|nr:hypothetical protein E3N88_11340 [Mikania micrantha]